MFAQNRGFQKAQGKWTAWYQSLVGFMATHVFLPALHSDVFYASILIAIFEEMRWGRHIYCLFCFLLQRVTVCLGLSRAVLNPQRPPPTLLPECSSALGGPFPGGIQIFQLRPLREQDLASGHFF